LLWRGTESRSGDGTDKQLCLWIATRMHLLGATMTCNEGSSSASSSSPHPSFLDFGAASFKLDPDIGPTGGSSSSSLELMSLEQDRVATSWIPKLTPYKKVGRGLFGF